MAELHFTRGYALAEAHQYEEAAVEFEQAYQKSPHHSVLYNLGQAYAMANKHVQAVQTLRRFLAEAERADPALVERARVALKRSERLVGTLQLSTAPGASVMIDGQAVAQPNEPQVLNVGTHGVWAQAPGYRDGYHSFVVVAGGVTQLELRLEPLPPAVKEVPLSLAKPTRALPPASESPSRLWSYVLGGTGLALGAGAIALYVKNSADYRELKDRRDLFAEQRREGGELNQAARDELASMMSESAKRQRLDDVALGLGIGAGVSIAAAAYLFWQGSSRAEDHASLLGCDGQRVTWRTTW